MDKFYRLFQVILATILLSGCEFMSAADLVLGLPGSNGAEQGFESETAIKSNALLSIKTIAILKIPEPPNYGRDTRFALENAEYGDLNFGNTAQVFLKNYLDENGFEVIEYSPNRENKHRLIYDYASLDIEGADAYLDVVPIEVEYKFRFEKNGPHVSTSFRLVSAVSNEEIYTGSIQYGWNDLGARSAGVKIESPEGHKYESSEALKANKKEAVEWLVQGIEAVSFSITRKIGKRDLNNKELSEHGPGFTGTYISFISGQTQALNIKGRNPEVKLTQNGKNISGTYGSRGGILWGEIEDGYISPLYGAFSNIRFKFQSSGGSTGTGKWTVNPNNREIIGKWSSSGREGEWNLVRIE